MALSIPSANNITLNENFGMIGVSGSGSLRANRQHGIAFKQHKIMQNHLT